MAENVQSIRKNLEKKIRETSYPIRYLNSNNLLCEIEVEIPTNKFNDVHTVISNSSRNCIPENNYCTMMALQMLNLKWDLFMQGKLSIPYQTSLEKIGMVAKANEESMYDSHTNMIPILEKNQFMEDLNAKVLRLLWSRSEQILIENCNHLAYPSIRTDQLRHLERQLTYFDQFYNSDTINDTPFFQKDKFTCIEDSYFQLIHNILNIPYPRPIHSNIDNSISNNLLNSLEESFNSPGFNPINITKSWAIDLELDSYFSWSKMNNK